MVSWDTCIASSPGNSTFSLFEICCGDHRSASHAATTSRNGVFTVSFAGFGRRPRSSARRSACTAR
jgi:hypothetical protein